MWVFSREDLNTKRLMWSQKSPVEELHAGLVIASKVNGDSSLSLNTSGARLCSAGDEFIHVYPTPSGSCWYTLPQTSCLFCPHACLCATAVFKTQLKNWQHHMVAVLAAAHPIAPWVEQPKVWLHQPKVWLWAPAREQDPTYIVLWHWVSGWHLLCELSVSAVKDERPLLTCLRCSRRTTDQSCFTLCHRIMESPQLEGPTGISKSSWLT